VLREGLRLLEDQQFQSIKLRDLAERVRNGSQSIRKLERLLNGLNERTKPWFYAPSLPLLFGTQLCMAIEAWRIKYGAALRTWLDAWAEFEAPNALANYAYENPEDTFPEFSTGEGEIRSGASWTSAPAAHILRPKRYPTERAVAILRPERFEHVRQKHALARRRVECTPRLCRGSCAGAISSAGAAFGLGVPFCCRLFAERKIQAPGVVSNK
jgi:hypothetical protein